MCGIAGQINCVEKDFAVKAQAALSHRGPDANGCWQSSEAALVSGR